MTPSNTPAADAAPGRKPWPFPTSEHHPPAAPAPPAEPQEPSEGAIDHGIEESFPASDPVSVSVTVVPSSGGTATPSDAPPGPAGGTGRHPPDR